MSLINRLKNAFNAFKNNEAQYDRIYRSDLGYVSYENPYRQTFTKGNERSIVTAVYNRMAIDVAANVFRHIRVDKENRYVEDIDSNLNQCLTVESNKDQAPRYFFQSAVESMFDEGCVAIVPVDCDVNPEDTDSYDILSMRVGRITKWYPDNVKVEIYNDRTGKTEEIIVEKRTTAIVENPLYAIMNEKNSILQRLIHKLNLLDVVDEQSGSAKLDLIIQLPYVIKNDLKREQAEQRRKDIEDQLRNSKYGIAYTDGTEKVTQLNRPIDNNLMTQIKYLFELAFAQLGITESILNGTASPEEMQNYMTRSIEPIAQAFAEEMNRKFISKTARTQGQRITFFNQPFKLISVDKMADIVDKFTRNEIMSSNEFRGILALKPVKDPDADALRNKNMPIQDETNKEVSENQNGNVNEQDLNELNNELTSLQNELNGLKEN